MTRRLPFGCPAVGFAIACTIRIACAQDPQGVWPKRPPPLVDPISVRFLPRSFVKDLTAEGCMIPQPEGLDTTVTPSNVITGHFAHRAQRDYAVLCSVNGVLRVLIRWGGRFRCNADFFQGADDGYGESDGKGTLIFSTAIFAASQREIADYRKYFGGPSPADRTHDGIESATLGKASVIFYCARGQWSQLTGMD